MLLLSCNEVHDCSGGNTIAHLSADSSLYEWNFLFSPRVPRRRLEAFRDLCEKPNTLHNVLRTITTKIANIKIGRCKPGTFSLELVLLLCST